MRRIGIDKKNGDLLDEISSKGLTPTARDFWFSGNDGRLQRRSRFDPILLYDYDPEYEIVQYIDGKEVIKFSTYDAKYNVNCRNAREFIQFLNQEAKNAKQIARNLKTPLDKRFKVCYTVKMQ